MRRLWSRPVKGLDLFVGLGQPHDMKRVILFAAGSVLLASCDPSSAPETRSGQPAATAPAKDETVATPEPLTAERLQALAFRTAWGAPPPVKRLESDEGPEEGEERTYDGGTLVRLEGDRYAFVSEGHGGEGHVNAGSLSIHYLRRTGDAFSVVGAWPAILVSGTWGNPPEWKIRTDLTPAPTLVAEAGGTWQGYSCTWAHVIELTRDRPVIRIDQIPMTYSDGGAREEKAQSMEGALIPGQKGRTIQVRYSGDVRTTVTYAKTGDVYDPVKPPKLLTC